KAKLAFAHLEPGVRYELDQVQCTARREGDGFRLDGRKVAVLHAEAADHLVVSARIDDGIALFVVDRAATGMTMHGHRTFDEMRAADIDFSGVRVRADAGLGTGDALPT